jgi:alpha-beta hydrolase superfamily lysophospholipase
MRLICLLAGVAVGAAGCSGEGSEHGTAAKGPPALDSRCGSDGENLDAELVWFRASDGTMLDGAAIGVVEVAVVRAHESPSDLCSLLPYAKTLESEGFRAFVFDLRGMGVSRNAKRFANQGRYDLDVEAAAAEVRRLGAKKVFLAGASAGGAGVLVAGASLSPPPQGVISLSGEPYLSRELDALEVAPKMSAPLLLVVASHDPYVATEDYRKLEQTAGSEDTRLVLYGGRWHGWDLLYTAPYKSEVNELILGFLNKYSGSGE